MAPGHQLLLSNKITASVLSLQQRAPCKRKPNAWMNPTRSFITLLSYLPRISPSSRQEVLPGRTSTFPGGSLRAAPRLSAGSKVPSGGREPPIAASLAFWPNRGQMRDFVPLWAAGEPSPALSLPGILRPLGAQLSCRCHTSPSHRGMPLPTVAAARQKNTFIMYRGKKRVLILLGLWSWRCAMSFSACASAKVSSDRPGEFYLFIYLFMVEGQEGN